MPSLLVSEYDNAACSGSDAIWNFLTVQLNRTSAEDDGDPDLFGVFSEGGSDVSPFLMQYCYGTCAAILRLQANLQAEKERKWDNIGIANVATAALPISALT